MSHESVTKSKPHPPAGAAAPALPTAPPVEHRGGSRTTGSRPPAGSLWPVVLAAGITLLLFGILTSFAFSVAGLAVTAAGVVGWIRELRDETP